MGATTTTTTRSMRDITEKITGGKVGNGHGIEKAGRGEGGGGCVGKAHITNKMAATTTATAAATAAATASAVHCQVPLFHEKEPTPQHPRLHHTPLTELVHSRLKKHAGKKYVVVL